MYKYKIQEYDWYESINIINKKTVNYYLVAFQCGSLRSVHKLLKSLINCV